MPKWILFVLHPIMLVAYVSAVTVAAVGWKQSPLCALLAAAATVICFAILLAWENYKKLPKMDSSTFDRLYD